jgi:general stress protein YciG
MPSREVEVSMADQDHEAKVGMSVREAGRKGGEATSRRHGRRFYEEIGRKGGEKMKRLIERAKRAE